MNRTGIACALLILFGTVSTHAASTDDLVKALESSFHVIQVNGLPETDEGGFDLIYSEESPEESAIPQSEVILNGLS